MQNRRGFTLVEILVALSIFLVLATFLISLSAHAANVWRRQNDLSTIRERARTALDIIGTELQLAAMPLEASSTESVQLVVNPGSVGDSYRSRDNLFWYAPIASPSSGGNLAAVGYFTREHEGSYQLCRYYAPSGSAEFLLYSDPDNWITDALLEQAAPADEDHKFKGLFLENIAGLWINAFDENGDPVSSDPDSRADGKLPARLEVSLVFLDTVGAALVKNGLELPATTASDDAYVYLKAVPDTLQSHVGAVSISISYRNRK